MMMVTEHGLCGDGNREVGKDKIKDNVSQFFGVENYYCEADQIMGKSHKEKGREKRSRKSYVNVQAEKIFFNH